MWFINDFSIVKLGYSEAFIIQVCKTLDIKIDYAFHKSKFMGIVISDEDYPVLIEKIKELTEMTQGERYEYLKINLK